MDKRQHAWISFAVIMFILFCGTNPAFTAQKTSKQTKEAVFSVMDPRGTQPPGELIPLAPRVSDFNNKTVYIIKSWPEDRSGLQGMTSKTTDAIKSRFPAANVIIKDRNTRYSFDDPQL